MEYVISLRRKEDLLRLISIHPDGVLFGSLFSYKYKHSISEFKEINSLLKIRRIKRYVSIDAFIFEKDKALLIDYIGLLKELNVDGIYFNDLAVYEIAKTYGIEDKLILDNDTLLTNSLDVAFYLSLGIDSVVMPASLTIEERLDILYENKRKMDMQVFGHLKLSNSKRKFLSNYFNEVGLDYPLDNDKAYRIMEEKRDNLMPIEEDENGTRIYTSYIFEMYEELPHLMPYINRAIIDDNFIDCGLLFEVLSSLKKLNKENASFIKEDIISKHPLDAFESGFLYTKTNKSKDEQD